jgi:hypothetical protein
VFAGAAREAVFSRPEVIRRINAEFVPLAVRATMANLIDPAGDEAEGRLYQRLKRTQVAPQGICVLNSDGQVLDWVETFENDASVLAFLDYAVQRFREHPAVTAPVAARRYMRYPTGRLPDVPDDPNPAAIAANHPAGQPCPALSRAHAAAPPGALAAALVGRSLDAGGQLSTDTVNQEHYVEDQFAIPADLQRAVVAAVDAASGRVRLPEGFGALCATYAFLGHIDVRPLDNPRGGSGERKRCEFWAEPVGAASPGLLRIEGQTEVTGDLAGAGGHHHQVQLAWEGFLTLDGNRITRLLLAARGTEALKYDRGQPLTPAGQPLPEVALLPGGRPVNQECGVHYGIIGTPVPGSAPEARAQEPPAAQPPAGNSPPAPEPARQLVGMLGPQFSIFLPEVQKELKLTAEQKQSLQEMLNGAGQGFAQFMQTVAPLPPDQREPKLQQFRQEANRAVGAALGQLLKPEQHQRLRQIVLQQEGLFAVGNPEVGGELKLTEDQQRRVTALMEETQKRFQALQEKAQAAKDPAAIHQEAARIRKEQEGKIEELLTTTQRARWKEMLGPPLPLKL